MSESAHPSVSFVIPCYNNEGLIALAIESALNQTVKPLEVIVVDDGSTDGSVPVIQRYGDRITLIRQENLGRVGARSAGIRRARGEWIALLDGDDEALPDRLEKQLDAVKRHPDAAIICGQLLSEDRTGSSVQRGGVLMFRHPIPELINFREIFRHNCIHTSSVLVCATAVKDLLDQWHPLGRELAEDYGLWMLVTTQGSAVHVETPVGIYRVLNPDSERRTLLFQRGSFLGRQNVIRYLRKTRMTAKLPGDWRAIMHEEAQDLGAMESRVGDPAVAGKWFAAAIAYTPLSKSAWGHWVLSALPPGIARFVRRAP